MTHAADTDARKARLRGDFAAIKQALGDHDSGRSVMTRPFLQKDREPRLPPNVRPAKVTCKWKCR